MTATPEAVPPHRQEHAERPIPKDALTGDDLLTVVREDVVAYCANNRYDASLPDRFMSYMEGWAATMQPGEPVLVLRRGYDELGTLYFSNGGWAASQLYGMQSLWERRTTLRVAITKHDYNGNHHEGQLEKPLEEWVTAHSYINTPPLWVVGEQPVREWMQQFGQRMTEDDPDRTQEYAEFIGDVKRSTLPLEYLGLSEERRAQLANRFLQFVLETNRQFKQEEVFKALEYLIGVTTDEERARLIDAIEDQWVDMLPLSTDMDEAGTIGLMRGIVRLRPIPAELTRDHDIVPEVSVRHAYLLAELYARRARRAANEPAPRDPERSVATFEHTELPVYGDADLRILLNDFPTRDVVTREMAPLLLLHEVGVPVTDVYERDMERMRRAAKTLCDRMLHTNDAGDRLQTLTALEYLFNVQRGPQRDEFYRLLIERYAQAIPLSDSAHRYIGVAEAIGRLMPHPPTVGGQPLAGSARTAAVVSRMYMRRAYQELGRQLRSYEPLGEHEEGSAASEIGSSSENI